MAAISAFSCFFRARSAALAAFSAFLCALASNANSCSVVKSSRLTAGGLGVVVVVVVAVLSGEDDDGVVGCFFFCVGRCFFLPRAMVVVFDVCTTVVGKDTACLGEVGRGIQASLNVLGDFRAPCRKK